MLCLEQIRKGVKGSDVDEFIQNGNTQEIKLEQGEYDEFEENHCFSYGK